MSVRIINAHVLDGLAKMPDESVHCVVTSPPYFWLRDYGIEPQVWGGGDPDCRHRWGADGKSGQRLRNGIGGNLEGSAVDKLFGETLHPPTGAFCARCGAWRGSLGLEPTPALYIEHLVAVLREVRRVLRPDGTLWIVIGDSYANDGKWGGATSGKHVSALHSSPICRNKRYTGLKPKDLVGIPWMLAFALRDDGWWLRKDIIWHKPNPIPESVEDRCTTSHEYVFHLSKSERYFYDADAIKEPTVSLDPRHASYRPNSVAISINGRKEFSAKHDMTARSYDPAGRNKRSVWTVATIPSSVPHFATYPPSLIEPCILAGCPVGGTVLDPFIGVGTTAIVAERLGRNCVGIELSQKYVAIAERRARSPGFPLESPEMAAE